jgi:hypothetical protein
MDTHRPVATLEPVRFGEFLRDRHLISDEQWLAALAQHWSEPLTGRRRMIGATIIENGYLAPEVVEAEARVFHDDLDVIEIEEVLPRSEKTTLPSIRVQVSVPDASGAMTEQN